MAVDPVGIRLPDVLRAGHRRGGYEELYHRLGAKTPHIEPGSLWENGSVERFNGKLRDELLNMQVLNTLLEARVLIE